MLLAYQVDHGVRKVLSVVETAVLLTPHRDGATALAQAVERQRKPARMALPLDLGWVAAAGRGRAYGLSHAGSAGASHPRRTVSGCTDR